MPVSPPFTIDETLPQSSNLLSQYPGQSQPFRDVVESWLTFLSDPSTGLLKSTAFAAPFEIESTDATANENPIFSLYRNSASPAASDVLGSIIWNGKDSAAEKQTYGRITVVATDVTNGSEDSTIHIQPVLNGALQATVQISPGSVTISGTITATSDRWLKTNIEELDLQSAYAALDSIYGYGYNWIDTGKPGAGFITQEVEPHFPSFVGEDCDGNQTLNYNGMLAVLWTIVKDQERRIAELEARLA